MWKFKKDEKLTSASAMYSHGFLFLGYKEHAFYWEFMKIYLRVFLLAFYELISDDNIVIKHMLMGTILAVYCVVFYRVKPYDHNLEVFSYSLNLFDFMTNVILFINIYLRHLTYTIELKPDKGLWVYLLNAS